MPGPVVERGDRLTFRTVERSDAEFLQRATTDPRIRWSLGLTDHGNREACRERIERDAESDGTHGFVVCLDGAAESEAAKGPASGAPASHESPASRETAAGHPGDGDATPIGAAYARGLDGDRAWLAYWLLPAYRGEGYGRELGGLVVDHAFNTSAVHGVSAAAFAFNEASRGLLESLGFSEDCCEREAYYGHGEHHDMHVYSLLRREWNAVRAQ
jgi:ribosomal-protein-alanine N-acetyltransferase